MHEGLAIYKNGVDNYMHKSFSGQAVTWTDINIVTRYSLLEQLLYSVALRCTFCMCITYGLDLF